MPSKRKYNTQPNIITNSTSEMSVIEKRVIYLAINQMDTGININPDLFSDLEFQIPISSLNDTNYDRVRKSVLKLQSRPITLIDNRSKEEVDRIFPFPRVKIKNGVVTLKMLSDIVPYFLELKMGFTKYELEAALSLTSVYSQKLYEHFSRWKDKQKWSISLDELKILLDAKNYQYPQFRQKCLEVAIPEINTKTDLIISYEVEKNGRSVSYIHFKILKKETQELYEATQAVEEELAELRTMRPSEVSVYVKNLLHNYTFSTKQKDLIMSTPSLFNTFVDLDSRIANGLINAQNPTNYIASVLFGKKKT